MVTASSISDTNRISNNPMTSSSILSTENAQPCGRMAVAGSNTFVLPTHQANALIYIPAVTAPSTTSEAAPA